MTVISVTRRHIVKDYFETRNSGSYFSTTDNNGNKHPPVTIAQDSVPYLSITAEQVLSITGTSIADIIGEVPTGLVNGVNVDFTLANEPIASTVRVYLNGIRQIETTNYSLVDAVITFVVAPFTDDVIMVDYKTIVTGVTAVYNEVPTGAINGVNTDFVILNAALSISVYLNGIRQYEGSNYTVSSDMITISFIIAPFTGDSLIVDYEY